jgi:hypothetical protein
VFWTALLLIQGDAPVELARAGRGQYLGQPALAAKNGRIVLIWEHHHYPLVVPVGNVDRWFVRRISTDAGRTFGPTDVPVRYYVQDILHPKLAWDKDGDLLLAFCRFRASVTSHFEGPSVRLMRSDDGGTSFDASSSRIDLDRGRAPPEPFLATADRVHLAAGSNYLAQGAKIQSIGFSVLALVLTPDGRPVFVGREGRRGLVRIGDEEPVEFSSEIDDAAHVAASYHKEKVRILWSSQDRLWLGGPGGKPVQVDLGDWNHPGQVALVGGRRLVGLVFARREGRHLIRVSLEGEASAPEAVSRAALRLDPSVERRPGLVQWVRDEDRVYVTWTDGRALWLTRLGAWH